MEYIAQLGLIALGSRMRAVSDRLYATADEVYRHSGLEIQGRWLPLLRILHDRGPLTVGEIAEAIGQTHSAVSQLADKLTDQGWLDVVVDPVDKRHRRPDHNPRQSLLAFHLDRRQRQLRQVALSPPASVRTAKLPPAPAPRRHIRRWV